MRATAHNTRGACQRCGKVGCYVMAVAFQGDGTATFRHLCASCERREKYQNEPHLFIGVEWVFIGTPEPEPVEEIEPEPAEIYTPQLSLWEPGELQRQPAQDKARIW